ncbi:MAG: hypothetical protein Q8P42_13810 [Gallionella sp.]|nr:hypothetical protein [Gallionella sp.]
MMRTRRFVLLLAALGLVGCDRITGADQQKTLDAEAIGYACRISLKAPQDCMQENEAHSPTSILYGWKEADKDVQSKVIDPSMGKNPPAPQIQQGAPAAAATENAAASASEKPAAAKSEKPAAAAGKPDQDAAEKKTAR